MRIDLFGPLRVVSGDRTVTARRLPGQKPKQLLEVLVAERGHVVTKSRLADLLWPSSPPQSHAAALETYVSALRQTLEPGVPVRDSVVVTERGGYRLDDARVSLDLEEFDALVASASGLRPVPALAALQAALALVRGEVLEDEPDAAWAEVLRAQYGRRRVQVLVDAGRLALVTGEPQLAHALAQDAVRLDPLAEPAYQVLMTAAYALFRQEEALSAYERCRTLLADELGVDPLDETAALHLSILRHEDVAALLPHNAPDAPPDVHTPTASDPAEDAAGAGRDDSGATAPLLGRQRELGRLQSCRDQAMRGRFTVALLVGDSGMGKTRLAETLLAGSEVPVGVNRCSDLETELPYVALSLALRQVVQDSPGGPVPVLTELLRRADLDEPDRFARLRAMERLAATVEEHSPFVLLLDDAHWADEESLATLGYLSRRCSASPVLVVLTTNRVGPRAELLRPLPTDLRLDLEALREPDVAPLGAGAYAATGGHPALVADWLAARRQGLSGPFTPELRHMLLRRCWALGPQTYRMLALAALLEQPFASAVLAVLLGTTLDVVEELERGVDDRILTSDADGYRFRHQIVRETLADTSSPGRAAQVRLRAAELLDVPQPRESLSESWLTLA